MEEVCVQKNKQERYVYIDILKVIAIFMVVFFHIFRWKFDFTLDNNLNSYFEFFVRILCEGVPIFVVVNGFLLINKEYDMKKFLRKTLSIFFLVIIWSFIYIIFNIIVCGEKFTINDIIYNNLLLLMEANIQVIYGFCKIL